MCGRASKQGYDACPSPSIPAKRIESFVVEELRVFASDDELDKAWDTMPPKERCRLIELLIERIDYDGVAGTIDITFHPAGLSLLGQDTNFARHISETVQ